MIVLPGTGGHQAKDPDSLVDFEVDWLGGGILRPGEAIASSQWTWSPAEPGGVEAQSLGFTPTAATARVSGGAVGRLYRLTNRITTSLGNVEEASFTLRIEQL